MISQSLGGQLAHLTNCDFYQKLLCNHSALSVLVYVLDDAAPEHT